MKTTRITRATIGAFSSALACGFYIYLFEVREFDLINLLQARENMIFAGVLLLALGLLTLVGIDKTSDFDSSVDFYKVILKVVFINLSIFLSLELLFGIFSK